jgi:large subunit ribosomal protein L38e
MAKQIQDIKYFLELARRKDAKLAREYLYTLVMNDTEKADKLRQSLPPTLKVEDVDSKKK